LASADLSAVSDGLPAAAVTCHPSTVAMTDGHRDTRETSPHKGQRPSRASAAFTWRPLDGIGRRDCMLARPDRTASDAVRVPRVAALPPASFTARLAAAQLPRA